MKNRIIDARAIYNARRAVAHSRTVASEPDAEPDVEVEIDDGSGEDTTDTAAEVYQRRAEQTRSPRR